MRTPHFGRPRLVWVNSRNITLCLRKTREKLKGDAFDPSGCGPFYDGGPETGRDAVPRPHGADVAVARPDVFAERPSRGPGVDHFLKGIHRSGTLQNVARAVNTKRSGLSDTIGSAMDEQPNDRLKRFREMAGHDTAESFAKQHNSINVVTYRAHEAGGRGIRYQVAERYAKLFKRYPATRHVTPQLILSGDSKASTTDVTSTASSIRSDYDALFDTMTEPELHDLWGWMVESIKLIKKKTG